MDKMKARVKNIYFWINILIAAMLTALNYLQVNPADVTTWGEFFQVIVDIFTNPFLMFSVLWAVWCEIHDPTEDFDSLNEKVQAEILGGVPAAVGRTGDQSLNDENTEVKK